MQYRRFLNNDCEVSEIGLGCASYWGNKYYSDKKAIAVVHHALDNGINYFDTGHSYSGGYAEIRLGKALKSKTTGVGVCSKPMIISSKVGTRVGNYGRLYKDFSAAWIRQSCEQSLKQLQVEHLSLFFLHGPNPEDFNDDVYQVLDELKQAGKVGVLGINSFDENIINLATDSQQFQSVMLDFNILSPSKIKYLEQLNQLGLDVVVAGAIAGGLYDRRFKQFRGMKSLWYWLRAWKNNQALMQAAKNFDFLNDQAPHTAIQLALAYVLANPHFCSALIGTTSVSHLDEILQADSSHLTTDILNQIAAAQSQ